MTQAAGILYAMRTLAEERRLPANADSLSEQPDLQDALVERVHRLLQGFGIMFIEFLQRAAVDNGHCDDEASPSSSPRLAAFVAQHKADGHAWLRQLSQSSDTTRASG